MSTYSSNEENAVDQIDLSSYEQIWRTIQLTFRKNAIIAITTLLLLLIALPVILIMVPINTFDSATVMELFRMLVAIPFFAISVVALILSAGQQFGFLHQKDAIDVFHALPVRRQVLFAGRFLGGFLLIILPQFISFISVFLLSILPDYRILDLSSVLQTAFGFALVSLAVYSVSVLSFVLTGKLFDAMFLLLMFNIAAPATLFTIDFLASRILPGFDYSNFVNLADFGRYFLLSPVGELFKVAFQPLSLFETLWWLAAILIVIAGGKLIYSHRPSELAGRPLAYRIPFLASRFIASLVAGLILGFLYYAIYKNLFAFMFGALAGSLAIHTLVEVIISRGFRHFPASLKSYLVLVLVIAAGYLAVATGFFGYDTRLPSKDKVVQIRLSTGQSFMNIDYYDPEADLVFSDPDNIETFLEMHSLWLNKMQTLVRKPYSLNTNEFLDTYDLGTQSESSKIVYKLSSGLEIVRTVYFNYNDEPYLNLYNRVRESEEFKRQFYDFFFRPDSQLSELYLLDKAGNMIQPLSNINSKELLADILEAFQKDLLANAERKAGSKLIGYLHMTMQFDFSGTEGNQGYSATREMIKLTDAYVNTLAILDKNKLLTNQNSYTSQYDAVYIARCYNEVVDQLMPSNRNSISGGPYLYSTDWRGFQPPLLNDEQVFTKIEDPKLIQTLYAEGQAIDLISSNDYLIFLALPGDVQPDGQTSNPILSLFLSADQLPKEIAGLLGN